MERGKEGGIVECTGRAAIRRVIEVRCENKQKQSVYIISFETSFFFFLVAQSTTGRWLRSSRRNFVFVCMWSCVSVCPFLCLCAGNKSGNVANVQPKWWLAMSSMMAVVVEMEMTRTAEGKMKEKTKKERRDPWLTTTATKYTQLHITYTPTNWPPLPLSSRD